MILTGSCAKAHGMLGASAGGRTAARTVQAAREDEGATPRMDAEAPASPRVADGAGCWGPAREEGRRRGRRGWRRRRGRTKAPPRGRMRRLQRPHGLTLALLGFGLPASLRRRRTPAATLHLLRPPRCLPRAPAQIRDRPGHLGLPPVPWRFDAAAAPTWDSSGLSRGGAVVGYGCYLVNDLYTGLYFEIDYS
jgi:hypothetical protein